MANKEKSVGRAYLVKKLQDRGLSRRKATRVVNAVLEAMIKALRQGKEVKFPFGKLRRVRKHFGPYWDSIDAGPAPLPVSFVRCCPVAAK